MPYDRCHTQRFASHTDKNLYLPNFSLLLFKCLPTGVGNRHLSHFFLSNIVDEKVWQTFSAESIKDLKKRFGLALYDIKSTYLPTGANSVKDLSKVKPSFKSVPLQLYFEIAGLASTKKWCEIQNIVGEEGF